MKNPGIYRKRVFALVCVMLLLGAWRGYGQETPDAAPPESPPPLVPAEPLGEGELRLNFRGAPLDTVLDYLSKAAGFIIVRDAEVSGRIDVWSHQPVSKDEAVDLLNTILNERGYAAIRNGRTLTIVNRDEAKTRDLPVRVGSDPEQIEKSDEMVTQIIPVRYADVRQLIENIKPLLPEYSVVSPNEACNAIIITDTKANIRRMAEIIKSLDDSISGIATLRVFTLRNAVAEDVARVITGVFQTSSSGRGSSRGGGRDVPEFVQRMRRAMAERGGGGGFRPPWMGDGGGGGGGESAARQAAVQVTAVADERTNSVIVGAPEEIMPTIADLVSELDAGEDLPTVVRVFPLEFAAADEMADVINDLFGEGGQRRGEDRQSTFRWGGPWMGRSQQEDRSARDASDSLAVAVPDERTNSVVVTADTVLMAQIEQMVAQLDADPAKDRKVFIYSLENANAEEVAGILEDTFQNGTGSRSSSRSRSSRNTESQSRTSQFGRGSSGFGGSSRGGTSFGR